MEPSRELVDGIFRERVLRARHTLPQDKFLAGPRLFDRVCRIMKDGIRHEFPDADENRVYEILVQRVKLARRLEGRR